MLNERNRTLQNPTLMKKWMWWMWWMWMREHTEETGKTSREVSGRSEEESSAVAIQGEQYCWGFVEDDCDSAMDCVGCDSLVVMFTLGPLKKTLGQEG